MTVIIRRNGMYPYTISFIMPALNEERVVGMVIVLVKEMLREFVGRAGWMFCVRRRVTSAI